MENGEGLGEKMPTKVTYRSFDDAMDPNHDEMDGGDDLGCSASQYSSCGESDTEKYCSANSAMGTPSICGSVGTVFHDFNDSDFGSMRSFKLSDENRNLRSFRGDKRFYSLGGSSSYYKSSTKGSLEGLAGLRNDGSFSKNELDVMHNPYANDQWRQMEELGTMDSCGKKYLSTNIVDDKRVEENISNLGSIGGLSSAAVIGEGGQYSAGEEQVSVDLGGLEVLSDLEYDGEDAGRYSNEGDSSTRHEHSESENSMFADDDNRENIYPKSTLRLINEGNCINGNMLTINSATVFGTDDWDDFEQEIGENPMGKIGQSELPDVISSGSSSFVAEGKSLHHNTQNNIQGGKQTHTGNDNVAMEVQSIYQTAAVSSSKTLSDENEDSTEKYAGRNQIPSAQGPGVHVKYQSGNKIDEARHHSDFQITSELKPSGLEKETGGKAPFIESTSPGGQEKKMQYNKLEVTSTGIPNRVEVKNMDLEEKTNILMNPLSQSESGQPNKVSGGDASDAIAEPVEEKDISSVKLAKVNCNNSDIQSSAIAYNHFEEYFTPTQVS
ncbi:hypothetical protein LIER_41986 [Lithospermum erythrorhizon]|uniref:Uncharacterized protein n=1 Tax=Lithospermum erythrorhizon TaxID=34254 RepID=A0AAV3RHW0_LITER